MAYMPVFQFEDILAFYRDLDEIEGVPFCFDDINEHFGGYDQNEVLLEGYQALKSLYFYNNELKSVPSFSDVGFVHTEGIYSEFNQCPTALRSVIDSQGRFLLVGQVPTDTFIVPNFIDSRKELHLFYENSYICLD